MTSEIMTVLGPVPAAQMGITLPHEHLLVNLARVTRNLDHLLFEIPLALAEVQRFREAGGSTIVEVTNRNLGRNPLGLQQIAQASGLHIVMGCGWYREPFYDREVYEKSTNQLADDIVRDITEGVDGTGVRVGIIGEVGSDDLLPISPAEERALRAAARAHRRTGLTITTHAAFSRVGLDQLDLLAEEGVDPRRVIVGHCGHLPDPDYHEALARRGAWVQFDRLRGMHGWEVEKNLLLVKEFIGRGYLHQLLLSHDVCMLPHLRAYGGTGYDFLLTGFIPRLLAAGLSKEQVYVLTVDNPRRALTGT